jgi:hypothetical protein
MWYVMTYILSALNSLIHRTFCRHGWWWDSLSYGHTDGPHLFHNTSSIRTVSIRERNITPQVVMDSCFIPTDHVVKRQTDHNRKVLDLSLQQSLLRGCSLHWTSSHLSMFRRKRMWNKKTQPTDYRDGDRIGDISILETDTLMCRSICLLWILGWIQFYEKNERNTKAKVEESTLTTPHPRILGWDKVWAHQFSVSYNTRGGGGSWRGGIFHNFRFFTVSKYPMA